MAPEQATNDTEPDCRSDIYALGAVAYFLATGRPPFDDDKPLKVILAHAQQSVVRPSEYAPDLPEDLEAVVLRCLAKSPDDRFQTVEQLQEAIQSCDCVHDWKRSDAAAWWRHHATVKLPERELAVL
jgi:serine/threonine-protein kinase